MKENQMIVRRLFRCAKTEQRSVFQVLREVMDIGISRLEQFEEHENWMEAHGKKYDDRLPF